MKNASNKLSKLYTFIKNNSKFDYFYIGLKNTVINSDTMYKLLNHCKLLFILLLNLSVIGAFASFKDMKFNYIKVENGLSSNRVKCVLRDHKGFVWIGTYMGGLNRFDGAKITAFEHINNDSISLSNNYINCIFEDSRNILWIGTDKGLNYFNSENETFQLFKFNKTENKSTNKIKINTILEDESKNLWFATDLGLSKFNFNTKKNSNIKFPTEIKGYNYSITDIAIDVNDNLWLSTNKGKIIYFKPSTFRCKIIQVPNLSWNKNIAHIIIDKYGIVWLGTSDNGLLSYNAITKQFDHYNRFGSENGSSGKDIRDMALDGNNIILAIDHGGLNMLNISTRKFEYCQFNEKIESGLNTNSIWGVYKDFEGILYVGTFNGGLNIYNPKRQRFLNYSHTPGESNSLINNSIRSIMEDSKGLIWIGTDGGGLSIFNPVSNNFSNYKNEKSKSGSLNNNAVLSIAEDQNKDIWLATWGGGINKFDRKTGKFISFPIDLNNPQKFHSANYYDIEIDRNGILWLSSYSEGIVQFDPRKGVINRIGTSILPSNIISNIRTQNDGSMGIITQNGYIYFDFGTGKYKTIKQFSNLNLNDVYRDKIGNYWAATNDVGLLILHPKGKIEQHNRSNGFPANSVVGIIEDNLSNMWISTTNGLVLYNTQTNTYQHFTIYDGLIGNEFSRLAYMKSKDNKLYFGGLNGFTIIDPKQISINSYIPNVYITEFQIFNKNVIPRQKDSPLKKSILETNEIVLSHKQSFFTLGFQSINMTYPQKTKYAYKMVGYDNDWIYTNADRNYATYTNLNPGSYTFTVKTSNNDGVWNETPAKVRIIIKPPFWRTWWAYTFYLIIILLIFKLIFNYSNSQLKSRNERIQAEKLNEIAQIKLKFFTNISHEFKTPLSLIAGPISRLLTSEDEIPVVQKKSYYHIIDRNVKALQILISQLLDMRKLDSGALKLEICYGNLLDYIKNLFDVFSVFANENKINYIFEASNEVIDGFFDPDKLDKIIRNLLSNALKFAKSEVKLKIDIITDFLVISVEDDGIGISSENKEKIFEQFYQVDNSTTRQINGTGIGLSLVKELVALYNGEIELKSELNKGSVFTIKLPFQKESFGQNVIMLDKSEIDENVKKEKDSETSMIFEDAEEQQKNQKPLLLIVEDNKDMLLYLESILSAKYNLVKAKDGLEGLEMATDVLPALIISDVMMPQMDGLTMTQKLKTDERTSHIPIILLTALSSVNNKIQGYETGADDYIDKPFNDELLLVRVGNILKSRQLNRDKFDQNIELNPQEITLNIADQKFLQRAISLIEQNMENYDFTTKDFISNMAMSRTQLNNKMKALTGKTIHEFIKSVQLKKAAQYLLTGEYNLSEVCYKVGFSNYVSFYNNFKEYFGVIPSNYIEKSGKFKV